MSQLLDNGFIKKFLEGNLETFFEGAKKIKKIKKITHKEILGKDDFSLIIEFILRILLNNGKIVTKSVFCKAHSEESKNKAIYYMEILYKNGFNEGIYQVPRSLTYVPDLRAGFYEGVKGKNLLFYLEQRDEGKIKEVVKDAAHWISKLHGFNIRHFETLQLPVLKIKNNKPPIRILLNQMRGTYNALFKEFYPLYKEAEKYENNFLGKLKKQEKTKVIYSDYHPENIIVPQYSKQGITVVDFTDLALGDPYRDVGTFLEQVEFMARKFMPKENGRQLQKIFLREYSLINVLKYKKQDWQRINLYCLWACLRNIIYFFYKKDPDQVIWPLLEDAKNYLQGVKEGREFN